jgi:hypothetical protein
VIFADVICKTIATECENTYYIVGIITAPTSILEEQNGLRQGCSFPHHTIMLVQAFREGESSVASFMVLVGCRKAFRDSLRNKLNVLVYSIIFA